MSLGIWPSYATHPTVLILSNWCLFIKLTRCLLLKTFDRKCSTRYLNDGSSGSRTVGHALPVPESSLLIGSKSLLEVIVEIWATSALRRMSAFNIPGAICSLVFQALVFVLFCFSPLWSLFFTRAFPNSFNDVIEGPQILQALSYQSFLRESGPGGSASYFQWSMQVSCLLSN